MKKKLLNIAFALAFIVTCGICFASCGVVAAAWVTLDMDGFVRYTTEMYPGRYHIMLYDSKETFDNDTYRTDYLLAITFYPRILGPDFSETANEDGSVDRTVVDISGYCDMEVVIPIDSAIYSANKKVYINGEALTPTSTNGLDGEDAVLVSYMFKNIKPKLVRGNPGGRANGVLNKIEYK